MNASTSKSSLNELLSHSDWLRGLARRLVVDEATAEDLLQETWLAVIKNPPALDRPSRPWLAGVVRNLAKLRYRGESRRAHRQEVAAQPEGLPSAVQLVEQVETERHLASVVLGIDEPYRTTVLLHYFQNLTLAEVAKRQSIPAATARWRHARGLELMRERLGKEYGGSRKWCQALVPIAQVIPRGDAMPGPATVLAGGSGAMLLAKWGGAALALGFALWTVGSDRAVAPAGSLQTIETERSGNGGSGESVAAVPSSLPSHARQALANRGSVPAAGLVESDGSASFRVHLVDDSAKGSLLGRRMVLVDSELACHQALVGDGGWASFDGIAEPLHLYVERPGSFAHGERVRGVGQELWVRLDAGAALDGHVLVNGEPADAGTELVLLSDRPLFGGRDWPDALTAEIFDLLGADLTARVRVGRGGQFAFHGLPVGWSGTLQLPAAYRLDPIYSATVTADATAEMRFDTALQGVLLLLNRRPRILGRVLDVEGTRPVPGALVRCEGRTSSGQPLSLLVTADATGTFEVMAADWSAEPFTIAFSAPGGRGRSGLSVTRNENGGDLQLGDLRLKRDQSWPVMILDPLGSPVEGARVRVGEFDSRATDEEGRTEVHLAFAGGSPFEIRAEGYRTRTASLPQGTPSLLVFELLESTTLTVTLAVPEHVWTTGLSLRLESNSGWTAERELASPVFRDLDPNAPYVLSVIDVGGEVLLSQDVRGLGSGEDRTIAVELLSIKRHAHMTIEDRGGFKLGGVRVQLFLEGREVLSSRSDRKGAFRQDFLPLQNLTLRLSKRGYCTREFSNAELPGQGAREKVVLERARDVRVIVSGARGEPVAVDGVIAEQSAGSMQWRARQHANGDFILFDVPRTELNVRIRVGARTILRSLEAEARQFVVTL